MTNEFVELVNSMKEANPSFRIYHGGLGGAPLKPSERPKPMNVLRDYIKENQIRVFDLFKKLDKDKSRSISVAVLVAGLKDTGVPLTSDELLQLAKSLDVDGDGEVDYK